MFWKSGVLEFFHGLTMHTFFKVVSNSSVILVALVVICPQVECQNAIETSDRGRIYSSLTEELILTQREKIAFDKFKARVFKKIPPELFLMRQDLYMLRFIRSKNLDVDEAERDILKFLKFMEDEHTLTIMEEDWSDVEEDYPFFIDAVDREGRPVMYSSLQAGWNVRRAALQGLQKRLVRYIYKLVFEANLKLIEVGSKNPNVTQLIIILDMEGFNLFQHACPLCMSTYVFLLELYERWIPGYAHDIVAINAPSSVYVVLQALRPFLSEQTNAALKIFGTNRQRWKPWLDERIDPNQLPWYIGGTRKD